MSMLLSRSDAYSVVAEDENGRIVGSNFLWEADTVTGIGPITVDVNVQNSSYGKAMMQDVIRRSDETGHPSIRLVQAAFHNRSLSLYTKLGFDTVEPLSNMQGSPLGLKIEGYNVRPMTEADLGAIDSVAFRVHGHTRHNEVAGAIGQGTAQVVQHNGTITGYTTGVGFFWPFGRRNESGSASPDRRCGKFRRAGLFAADAKQRTTALVPCPWT
jgi:hypothetical protein